jgi:hypothetical protein
MIKTTAMKCSSPPEWKRFRPLGMGIHSKPTLCSERKNRTALSAKDGAPGEGTSRSQVLTVERHENSSGLGLSLRVIQAGSSPRFEWQILITSRPMGSCPTKKLRKNLGRWGNLSAREIEHGRFLVRPLSRRKRFDERFRSVFAG